MRKLALNTLQCAVLMIALSQVAVAQVIEDCGQLRNGYGPFDYTNTVHRRDKLQIVEEAHFDAATEQLVARSDNPYSAGTVSGELDYTLRAFPNHHRALFSMLRYYVEKVPAGDRRMPYSAECYFVRAKRFVPSDATVLMLEGIYFHKIGRDEEAMADYEQALKLAPNSAEVHYNAALMYTETKQYDLAMKHAAEAYKLGYPLQGLRNKLTRLGEWHEDQIVTN